MNHVELDERLKRVRLLVLDLDGVLTDGRIFYGDHGDELKSFHMQDGFGLVLLQKSGIPTVIISGKKSRVNERRAKELKIAKLFQNISDKAQVLQKTLQKMKLTPEETCVVGDDILDIPILKGAGFAVAVQNAVPEVKEIAHYVTQKKGGDGAVREVVDLILKGQGKWPIVTGKYF